MSRTQDQVTDEIVSLLPTGQGWPVGVSSELSKTFAGLAATVADFEASAEALLQEIDPRTAENLLTDFERTLGPDPCMVSATATLTLDQRKIIAYTRWTARGGQSRAYYTAVAKALGFDITITEFRPRRFGDPFGQPYYTEDWRFVWQVNVPAFTIVNRKFGSPFGEPYATWDNTSLFCALRRLAPAHTLVIFQYGSAASVQADFGGDIQ